MPTEIKDVNIIVEYITKTDRMQSGTSTARQELKSVKDASKSSKDEVTKLEKGLKELGDEAAKTAKKTDATGKSIKKTGAEAKKASKEVDKLAKNTSNAGASAAKSKKQFQGLGSTVGGSLKSLSKFFVAGLGIGSGLEAFNQLKRGISSTIDINKQFEESLSQLSSITGAVGTDLGFYSDEAKRLGATTTVSATQTLEAFKLIGSLKPELLAQKEALVGVTEEAIALAEASGLELPVAGRALVSTLNQFNAPASEAAKFINALAAGSKEGAGAIPELTDAIGVFGTVADQANITIEQSVGLTETLAEKNIIGAKAGTQLRNIIIKLQAAGIGYKDGLFDINTALTDLNKKNLSIVESTKLFGVESVTAGNILVQNIDRFKDLTNSVTGTRVAYEQAAINTDNYAGQQKRLASSLEGVALRIGKSLIPVLADLTENVAGLLSPSKTLTDTFYEKAEALDSLQTNIVPLVDRYEELKGKVNEVTGESELNKDEQTELDSIMQQLAKTVPYAVEAFDEYGKAITVNSGLVNEFIQLTAEETEARRLQAIEYEKIRIRRKTAEQESLKETIDGYNEFIKNSRATDEVREKEFERAEELRLKYGELTNEIINGQARLKQLESDDTLTRGLRKARADREAYIKSLENNVDASEKVKDASVSEGLTIADLRVKLKDLKAERENLLRTDKKGAEAKTKEIDLLDAEIKALTKSADVTDKRDKKTKALTGSMGALNEELRTATNQLTNLTNLDDADAVSEAIGDIQDLNTKIIEGKNQLSALKVIAGSGIDLEVNEGPINDFIENIKGVGNALNFSIIEDLDADQFKELSNAFADLKKEGKELNQTVFKSLVLNVTGETDKDYARQFADTQIKNIKDEFDKKVNDLELERKVLIKALVGTDETIEKDIEQINKIIDAKLDNVNQERFNKIQEEGNILDFVFGVPSPQNAANFVEKIKELQEFTFEQIEVNRQKAIAKLRASGFDSSELGLKEEIENARSDILVLETELLGTTEGGSEFLRIKNEIIELRKLIAELTGETPESGWVQKLLGLTDEQFVILNNSAKQFISAARQYSDTILADQLNRLDSELAAQEDKVSKARDLASSGNSEQLQLEEERLFKIQEKREAAIQRQRQLASVEIAISNAVAIAKQIQGISEAAALPFPANIAAVALTAATIVTQVASTVASLNDSFGSIPSYRKGIDRFVPNDGSPESDGGIAVLHKNERVLTANQNRPLLRMGVSGDDIPRLVELGLSQDKFNSPLLVNNSHLSEKVISNDRIYRNEELIRQNETIISQNKNLLKAVKSIRVTQKVDKDGIVQMFQSHMNKQSKINVLKRG